jgi:aldehyde dehydrogenase (NAD+)
MATAKTIPLARHPYADGSYKQMLVDGRWVDAASGNRFESRNPATGEVLATVADGDAEDVNRAVAAARKAFEGPWSEFKPYQRQQLLLKLADLVERHFDELSVLDTLQDERIWPRVGAAARRGVPQRQSDLDQDGLSL